MATSYLPTLAQAEALISIFHDRTAAVRVQILDALEYRGWLEGGKLTDEGRVLAARLTNRFQVAMRLERPVNTTGVI